MYLDTNFHTTLNMPTPHPGQRGIKNYECEILSKGRKLYVSPPKNCSINV